MDLGHVCGGKIGFVLSNCSTGVWLAGRRRNQSSNLSSAWENLAQTYRAETRRGKDAGGGGGRDGGGRMGSIVFGRGERVRCKWLIDKGLRPDCNREIGFVLSNSLTRIDADSRGFGSWVLL